MMIIMSIGVHHHHDLLRHRPSFFIYDSSVPVDPI